MQTVFFKIDVAQSTGIAIILHGVYTEEELNIERQSQGFNGRKIFISRTSKCHYPHFPRNISIDQSMEKHCVSTLVTLLCAVHQDWKKI